jgi:hypothetical protein
VSRNTFRDAPKNPGAPVFMIRLCYNAIVRGHVEFRAGVVGGPQVARRPHSTDGDCPYIQPDKPRLLSFEEVVLPHLDAAYHLARSLTETADDAEDIVQEAALRAFRLSLLQTPYRLQRLMLPPSADRLSADAVLVSPLQAARLSLRSCAALHPEILALRHQLQVLQRWAVVESAGPKPTG